MARWQLPVRRTAALGIATVLVFLGSHGCGLAFDTRLCINGPEGIYFNEDGTAYVAALPPWFSEVVLWKVDLAERRVLDVWVVRERRDPSPQDRTLLEFWDQARREYYVTASWKNKAIADGLDRKEVVTPGGIRYIFSDYGETLRIALVGNRTERVLIHEEQTADVTDYRGMVTLVQPGKVYIMVNRAKYTPGRPIGKGTEPRGAFVYVVEAESGQVRKKLPLWADAGIGTYGLAQAPDSLVYAYNDATNVILVIDPQKDEVVGKISLCK